VSWGGGREKSPILFQKNTSHCFPAEGKEGEKDWHLEDSTTRAEGSVKVETAGIRFSIVYVRQEPLTHKRGKEKKKSQ